MNSSLVWKRLARLDDDPTFREIERAQPSFRRKGSKGDFYFLLCDPTDGRYLSTGPASCDTICRDYRIYALYIRHFPFSSSSFFISFYLSSSPLERKLNLLEKPPIFHLLACVYKFAIVGKRVETMEKSEREREPSM